MGSDYKEYDVRAADIYDSHPKWLRFTICLYIYITNKTSWKDFRNKYLEFEIYLRTQSLQRKMNKLYFKWDNQ